ncbi:hypothetical protein ACFT8P_13080 [Streptomyces sp. NPDC057101]|uniref:hypothetical protein n=1 Tax=Streptomyces sp. NPDC057101 TaxID=3346020 RepID=UPI00362D1080
MLQGLRKPGSGLSRGALVSDIVNTVAITAIRSQVPRSGLNGTAKRPVVGPSRQSDNGPTSSADQGLRLCRLLASRLRDQPFSPGQFPRFRSTQEPGISPHGGTSFMSESKWDVHCPEEGHAVMQLFDSIDEADQAAVEHNAEFTPPHTAGTVPHTPTDPDPPHLTGAQRDAFTQNESDFAELEEHTLSVREAASARLRDANYDPGSSFHCFRCPCPSFKEQESVPPSLICTRPYCRHHKTSHDFQ